jgi:hypothetical protein
MAVQALTTVAHECRPKVPPKSPVVFDVQLVSRFQPLGGMPAMLCASVLHVLRIPTLITDRQLGCCKLKVYIPGVSDDLEFE